MQYWDEEQKKFVNVSKSNPLPTVSTPVPEPAGDKEEGEQT